MMQDTPHTLVPGTFSSEPVGVTRPYRPNSNPLSSEAGAVFLNDDSILAQRAGKPLSSAKGADGPPGGGPSGTGGIPPHHPLVAARERSIHASARVAHYLGTWAFGLQISVAAISLYLPWLSEEHDLPWGLIDGSLIGAAGVAALLLLAGSLSAILEADQWDETNLNTIRRIRSAFRAVHERRNHLRQRERSQGERDLNSVLSERSGFLAGLREERKDLEHISKHRIFLLFLVLVLSGALLYAVMRKTGSFPYFSAVPTVFLALTIIVRWQKLIRSKIQRINAMNEHPPFTDDEYNWSTEVCVANDEWVKETVVDELLRYRDNPVNGRGPKR